MPAAAKTPFSSKNPATLVKSFSGLQSVGSSGAVQGGEVVCPLFNSDGSQCRKKCVGNFAYRSICEHIRRAHPDNWIPKLPASPETFAKMVGLIPRGAVTTTGGPARKHMTATRKPSKLPKHIEEPYLEGMSPPSSASESDVLPPLTNTAIFQSRFAAAYPGQHDYDQDDYDDEHELNDNRSMDDDLSIHTETETEDDEYSHLHHHGYYRKAPHGRTQRKRQSTLDSSSSSSFSSFGSSRWDELIEAATTRAVVENSPPLSPPPTANALPTLCPNTPSDDCNSTSFHSPKVQCSECRALVSIKNSYVCTDCVSGFCEDCALAAARRGNCSECRAFGGKFKPLKVIIRT